MTKKQTAELQKATNILVKLFWDLHDNSKNQKEESRLETILTKLFELRKLQQKG